MSIKWKFVTILCVIFVIMLAIFIAYTLTTTSKICKELDEQEIFDESKRVLNTLNREIEEIDKMCKDWAYWDDTYEFVIGKNEDYIESNLVNETFVDVELNFIIILNKNMSIIYAKAYDWKNKTTMKIPKELYSFVKCVDKELRGVVKLDKLSIIAVRKILPSNESGESRGYLIFGRYLYSDKISRIVGYDVHVQSTRFENLTYKYINNSIKVYVPVRDIYGKVVANFVFEVYPFWFEILKSYMSNTTVFMTLTTVTLCVATVLLLNRDVRKILIIMNFLRKVTSDLNKRLILKGNDEISELANGINEMLDRIEKSFRDVKVLSDSLRFLNKVIRHDVRNKLTAILGYAELGKKSKNPEYYEKIEDVIKKTVEMIDRIKELEGAFSELKLKEMDIVKVIEEVMKGYNVEWSVKGRAKVKADEGLYTIIDNLVQNAIKHGKSKKIEFYVNDLEEFVEIRVVDYGVGIPDEIKDRIFDEGFSTSSDTGLGLFIVKKLVERYNGSISVTDNEPSGTVFVIKIPKYTKRNYGQCGKKG